MPVEKGFSGELEEFFRLLVLEPVDKIVDSVGAKRYEDAMVIAGRGARVFRSLAAWINMQNRQYEEGFRLAIQGVRVFNSAQTRIKLFQNRKYKGIEALATLRKQILGQTSSDRQVSNKRKTITNRGKWEIFNRGKLTS